MWTNGGDETDLKSPQVAEALQLWKDLVDDGSVSKSVVNWKQSDVNDQFIAGKAAMMLNGPWQIPRAAEGEDQLRRGPVPGQQARPDLGRPARWRGVDRDRDRQQREDDRRPRSWSKCMNTDENQMLRAKQGGLVPTKARAGRAVQDGSSVDGRLHRRGGRHARARTGKLGAKWPETAKVIYTGMQLVLTGQAAPADAMAKAGAS